MKFYLANPNKQITPIYSDLSYKGKRIRLSTGISINPKSWDVSKERVTNKDIDNRFINTKLETILLEIKKLQNDSLVSSVQISFNDFKKRVMFILKPDSVIVPNSKDELFADLFLKWINNKYETSGITHKTFESYKSNLAFIKKFDNYKGHQHRVSEINKSYCEEVIKFSFNQLKINTKTLESKFRQYKICFTELKKDGYNINEIPFTEFKLNGKLNNELIALTEEQVDKILNVNVNKKSLKKVMDLLIVQLHTSQRYSDVQRISKENIRDKGNGKVIELMQQKTRHVIELPLTKKIEEVLERNNGKLPILNLRHYNIGLRKLAELAGLNDKIIRRKRIGVKVEEILVPLYKVLSSHCIRATTITLLGKKGYGIPQIMNISGHREIKTLNRYFKNNPTETALEVTNMWNNKG